MARLGSFVPCGVARSRVSHGGWCRQGIFLKKLLFNRIFIVVANFRKRIVRNPEKQHSIENFELSLERFFSGFLPIRLRKVATTLKIP